MTILQAVFAAVAFAVLLGCALIVAGVAVLFGLGWALITGGIVLAATAAILGVILLREPDEVPA